MKKGSFKQFSIEDSTVASMGKHIEKIKETDYNISVGSNCFSRWAGLGKWTM